MQLEVYTDGLQWQQASVSKYLSSFFFKKTYNLEGILVIKYNCVFKLSLDHWMFTWARNFIHVAQYCLVPHNCTHYSLKNLIQIKTVPLLSCFFADCCSTTTFCCCCCCLCCVFCFFGLCSDGGGNPTSSYAFRFSCVRICVLQINISSIKQPIIISVITRKGVSDTPLSTDLLYRPPTSLPAFQRIHKIFWKKIKSPFPIGILGSTF